MGRRQFSLDVCVCVCVCEIVCLSAARRMGELWRDLDARGRAPFMTLAAADRVRVDRELAVWSTAETSTVEADARAT